MGQKRQKPPNRPSHHFGFPGISVWTKGGYRTPLGVLPVDEDFAQALVAKDDLFINEPAAYNKEHSLEVELPFIQKVFPDGVKIVPVIMGHEFCGVIEETGTNVKGFSPGHRVVSETAAVICGTCRQCRSGNYHLCPDRKGFGYGVDGAFTDYVKVPVRCLHKIPEGVSV